jgi:hypothetical protein
MFFLTYPTIPAPVPVGPTPTRTAAPPAMDPPTSVCLTPRHPTTPHTVKQKTIWIPSGLPPHAEVCPSPRRCERWPALPLPAAARGCRSRLFPRRRADAGPSSQAATRADEGRSSLAKVGPSCQPRFSRGGARRGHPSSPVAHAEAIPSSPAANQALVSLDWSSPRPNQAPVSSNRGQRIPVLLRCVRRPSSPLRQ